MIHGSVSGLLDPGFGRYNFGAKVAPCCGGQIQYFWRQNGALLWRADLSLGKLILAQKRHLTVEVASGFTGS